VLSEMESDSRVGGWYARQREAAAQLDEMVTSLLVDIGRDAWGSRRGRDWQIVATPDEAAWRLYHLVSSSGGDGWSYQDLGVRATVAPDGRVVALQVDSGQEFLALADTSALSLRRGLQHLLAKGLPVREAVQPPFKVGGRSLITRLGALFRR
jgi:hypothetical protein